MLQTTTMPLSKGSLHSCTFKRIPDETRFHIIDPNVIQKVESSGKYILTYKEPDTTYLNILQTSICVLRKSKKFHILFHYLTGKFRLLFSEFQIRKNNLPSCLFMVAGILEAVLWSYEINAVFLPNSLVQL